MVDNILPKNRLSAGQRFGCIRRIHLERKRASHVPRETIFDNLRVREDGLSLFRFPHQGTD